MKGTALAFLQPSTLPKTKKFQNWLLFIFYFLHILVQSLHYYNSCSLMNTPSLSLWILEFKKIFVCFGILLNPIILFLLIFLMFIYYHSACQNDESYPVGWGCRIHRLLLCRGVRPPTNECPGYDTKQSDGEVPAILELWGMQSIPLLRSLPGPLWPGVAAPDKGPIYGLNRTKRWLAFTVFIHLNCVFMLNWIV